MESSKYHEEQVCVAMSKVSHKLGYQVVVIFVCLPYCHIVLGRIHCHMTGNTTCTQNLSQVTIFIFDQQENSEHSYQVYQIDFRQRNNEKH